MAAHNLTMDFVDRYLTLKVMRLTKPSLMCGEPVVMSSSAAQDDVSASLNSAHARSLATVPGLPHFALSNLLTLPQNFGNIFLGETFSSYISVHNDSQHPCKDILVKADLQTSSQRLTLSAQQETTKELQPQHSIDEVIHHEVKELGTHILVCAVSYTSSTGEKMYFRKFFKFQVLKPLDVKTKFYNAEDLVSDEVYLEAQIQNITPGPIFMERVELDPSQHYISKSLNTQAPDSKDSGDATSRVFGQVDYMSPLDVRQYLYCLSPRPDPSNDPRHLKSVTNIGKLDIVWKSNLGEKGRLQTSPLQRVAPGFGDIRLTVESIPDSVRLEETVPLKIKITNCCERTMDLVLVMENAPSAPVLWCGVSGREIGKLPPNSAKLVELKIIGVAAGLQSISGLRLTDTFLKRTYEHDEIAQVFIYSHECHEQ